MKCIKCEKPIETGTPYFSILKNIETNYHDFKTSEEYIEVLDSVSIFELCPTCGNRFDPEVLVSLFKIAPLNNKLATRN